MSSIDIVVPCYKYAGYLRECVTSVLAQEVDALRILIIDDASPDDTPEVAARLVAEDPRVEYLRHSVNLGHIATYNQGIDWCEADYMLLLSADDCLLPGALNRAMGLLDAEPDMGLVFGPALEMDPKGDKRRMSVACDFRGQDSIVLSGTDFIRLCARRRSINIVPTPTAVVRTDLLKALGGYRPSLPHSADLELWLRIAAHASVGALRHDQAIYRRHATNMSNAYYDDHMPLDIVERRTAFDSFRESCGKSNPTVASLHAELIAGLSRHAIKHANDAFNLNRRAPAESLSGLALQLDPRIRMTSGWWALAIKKLIGFELSSAIRFAAVGCALATKRRIARAIARSAQRRAAAEWRDVP